MHFSKVAAVFVFALSAVPISLSNPIPERDGGDSTLPSGMQKMNNEKQPYADDPASSIISQLNSTVTQSTDAGATGVVSAGATSGASGRLPNSMGWTAGALTAALALSLL